jgi:hypothetical protein
MKVENFKNPLIILLYAGTCCENVGIFFFFFVNLANQGQFFFKTP